MLGHIKHDNDKYFTHTADRGKCHPYLKLLQCIPKETQNKTQPPGYSRHREYTETQGFCHDQERNHRCEGEGRYGENN